jgi:hypothetical protein
MLIFRNGTTREEKVLEKRIYIFLVVQLEYKLTSKTQLYFFINW